VRTTFTKTALLVLLTRIELVIQSYQDCGMPLTYKSHGVLYFY